MWLAFGKWNNLRETKIKWKRNWQLSLWEGKQTLDHIVPGRRRDLLPTLDSWWQRGNSPISGAALSVSDAFAEAKQRGKLQVAVSCILQCRSHSHHFCDLVLEGPRNRSRSQEHTHTHRVAFRHTLLSNHPKAGPSNSFIFFFNSYDSFPLKHYLKE